VKGLRVAFSFFKRNRKIGLALGGGAARGLAHIGVLKALSEAEIPIDYVAGTSVGSVIGALYCAGYPWFEIKEIAGHLNWGKLITPTIPVSGLAKTEKLEHFMEKLLKGKSFKDLSIPFCAVAVDIEKGREVLLREGPVARAVQASSSIPGIFEPTTIGGKILVDGGVINNVPSDVAREMGAGIVIAVDLNHYYPKTGTPKHILDIIYATMFIIMNNKSNRADKFSDYLVAPDLSRFSYYNLKNMDKLIKIGEKSVAPYVEKLKKKF
jgi:NTE family protein